MGFKDFFSGKKSSSVSPVSKEEFIKNFLRSAMETLSIFSFHSNRFGVIWGNFKPVEGSINYDVRIAVSDGFLCLLPCISEQHRKIYTERYLRCLEIAKRKFGENSDAWPPEALDIFETGNYIHFSVTPGNIENNQISFAILLGLISPEGSFAIKNPFEKALPKQSDLHKCPNNYEGIKDYLAHYLTDWMLAPGAWKTARDRRIEYFANIIAETILDSCPNWHHYQTSLPRKCFAIVFWINDFLTVAELADTPVKEECAKIVGTMVNPGTKAALIINFDIRTHFQGMTISAYMPIPYDPIDYEIFKNLLKEASSIEPIIEIDIPEDAFDFKAESATESSVERKPIEVYAVNVAREVLRRYGVLDL